MCYQFECSTYEWNDSSWFGLNRVKNCTVIRCSRVHWLHLFRIRRPNYDLWKRLLKQRNHMSLNAMFKSKTTFVVAAMTFLVLHCQSNQDIRESPKDNSLLVFSFVAFQHESTDISHGTLFLGTKIPRKTQGKQHILCTHEKKER